VWGIMTNALQQSRRFRTICASYIGMLFVLTLLTPIWAQAQSSTVPRFVMFNGLVKDAAGNPQSGTVGITFALYKEEQGGSPLWLETQNVQADAQGQYSVNLGATKPDGLPQDLFVSGEARWLGVRAEGQSEQPRALLLSVPYALKAGDAQTVGGLLPSAFMRAPSVGSSNASALPSSTSLTSSAPLAPPLAGSGTVNFVPLWTPNGTTLGNSVLFQAGTGATAKIGLNTGTPAATLDVKGTATIRGILSLPATGTATSSGGKTSQPLNSTASVFNSSTSAAVAQNFRWQAEPVGNNTSNPGGKLNLLFSSGSNSAAETGLSIASNGLFTFATGQAFPGTGTITGVTAGTDLTGGGTSGNVTLNVDTSKVVTGVTAGTDLTGGGTGGVPTLNLDTTKVPQLKAANTFTGNQTVIGNLTATATVTGAVVSATSSFNLGSNLFAFGSLVTLNTYLGFAGTSSGNPGTNNTGVGSSALLLTTGSQNTAVGVAAFAANTTGSRNTAVGYFAGNGGTTVDNTAIGFNALSGNFNGIDNYAGGSQALDGNFEGSFNTGVGMMTLHNNGNGNYNSALGYKAGTDIASSSLTNTTAIGALADVSQNNSMVLGSINGVNTATADTNVGIGTTAPQTLLHIDHKPPVGVGQDILQLTSGGSSDVASLLIQNTGPGLRLRLGAGTDSTYLASSGSLEFATGDTGNPNHPATPAIFIDASGHVGIGETFPGRPLQIGLGTGHAIADGWDTYSSRRWKTNIHTLDRALAKVEQLRGVSYDLKGTGKHEIGVIAEEVGQVVPEIVSFEANGKDAQGVDYTRLTAVLIEAVKQQQRQIRAQALQIQAQARQISLLNGKVGVLETAIRTTKRDKVAVAEVANGNPGAVLRK
jgi:Chaperone of endosialidase